MEINMMARLDQVITSESRMLCIGLVYLARNLDT